MTDNSTKPSVSHSDGGTAIRLLEDWFDPIEASLRDRVGGFIQAMIETGFETVLARPR